MHPKQLLKWKFQHWNCGPRHTPWDMWLEDQVPLLSPLSSRSHTTVLTPHLDTRVCFALLFWRSKNAAWHTNSSKHHLWRVKYSMSRGIQLKNTLLSLTISKEKHTFEKDNYKNQKETFWKLLCISRIECKDAKVNSDRVGVCGNWGKASRSELSIRHGCW